MEVLTVERGRAIFRSLREAGFTTTSTDLDDVVPRLGVQPLEYVVVLSTNIGRLGSIIETLKSIRNTRPNTPVVVATTRFEKEAARAYEAGATSVAPPDAVKDAVANVAPIRASLLQKNVIQAFHDPRTGRLDAGRVAKEWILSSAQVAKAVGVTPSALARRPTAPSAQPGLREIEFAWATLIRLLRSSTSAKAWLNAAHPDLGGEPPIKLLTEGSAKALADYLRKALTGQPT